MERPVRSAYMDIVDQRKLDEGSYRVTIAANEQVRQPPELDCICHSAGLGKPSSIVPWPDCAPCHSLRGTIHRQLREESGGDVVPRCRR